MSVLHSYRDQSGQCFANVRLDDGAPCFISVAQTGILVRKSRLGLMGQTLYKEPVTEKLAMTTKALSYLFPDIKVPDGMTNPMLRTFVNAVLHCSTASDVKSILNEAVLVAQLKSGGPIKNLKENLSVDRCADLYFEALTEEIQRLRKTIERHAAENLNEEQLDALAPELWAVELTVLNYVFYLFKVPEIMHEIIPILIVSERARINPYTYKERLKFYSEAASPFRDEAKEVAKNLEKATGIKTELSEASHPWVRELAVAFVIVSGITFKNERTNVNKAALEWAISGAVIGAFKGLSELTGAVLQDYSIQQ